MSDDQRNTEEREEHVEDLDVSQDEANDVKGGRKAGKGQQEYMEVKLQDAQITSY
jgi:hypothetical protein